jgi:hypothetical protein
MIPEVQTELHLTAQQKDDVRQIMEANRPPRPEPGTPPPPPEQQHQLVERIHNALKAKLADGQFRRLLQLELQAEGAFAIARPDVSERLNLTDAEKESIHQILEDNRPPRPEPGTPPPSPDEMDAQRKKVERLILAVLTEAQKSQWNDMKGAPFTFPRPPRP